jgi:hypothetical protein
MRKCECGNDVANNARACPNCGHRFTSRLVKGLAWFMCIVGATGALAIMLSSSSQTTTTAPVAPILAPHGQEMNVQPTR